MPFHSWNTLNTVLYAEFILGFLSLTQSHVAPNQNSLVTIQFPHLSVGLPSQRYFSFPSSGREEENAGTGDISAGPRETLQGESQRGRQVSPLSQVQFLASPLPGVGNCKTNLNTRSNLSATTLPGFMPCLCSK